MSTRIVVELGGPRIRDWIGDQGPGGLAPPSTAADLGGGLRVVGANLPAGEVTILVTRLASIADPERAEVDRIVAATGHRLRAFAGELLNRATAIRIEVER